jgi:hypothetical protein
MVAFTIPSRTSEFTLQFLQQEWINDGNFMGLSRERDPNVGLQDEGAIFTIPKWLALAVYGGPARFPDLTMPTLFAALTISEQGGAGWTPPPH